MAARTPRYILTDAFFDNKAFKEVNATTFTGVYTSVAKDNHAMHAGNKLGIIDRAVRTLKMYISKQLIEEKGSAFLTDVVELYNSTPHVSLNNRSPKDVYEDVSYMVKRHFENMKYNRSVKLKLHSKFRSVTRSGSLWARTMCSPRSGSHTAKRSIPSRGRRAMPLSFRGGTWRGTCN